MLLGGASNDKFSESVEIFNQPNITNIHIGLKNLEQNVCFFNSVIQLLYSIPKLRAEIFNRNDLPLIKNLFREIRSAKNPVETFPYVIGLGMNNYQPYSQFDAQECLSFILNCIYPLTESNRVPDNHLFKISYYQKNQCELCGTSSNNSVEDTIFPICFMDTSPRTSVKDNLRKLTDDSIGESLHDFTCQYCNKKNCAKKYISNLSVNNLLLIQLKIFYFDKENGVTLKLAPNIDVDNEITIHSETFLLKAIIYHHGKDGTSTSSGHYTVSIKYDEEWFVFNDDKVFSESVKLTFSKEDFVVPYLILYEKKHSHSIKDNLERKVHNTIKINESKVNQETSNLEENENIFAMPNIKSPSKRSHKFSSTQAKKHNTKDMSTNKSIHIEEIPINKTNTDERNQPHDASISAELMNTLMVEKEIKYQIECLKNKKEETVQWTQKRLTLNLEKKRKKEAQALRKKNQRANASINERKKELEKNATRNKFKRKSLSENEQKKELEKDAARKKFKRKILSEDEQKKELEKDATRKKIGRKKASKDERKKELEKDADRKKIGQEKCI